MRILSSVVLLVAVGSATGFVLSPSAPLLRSSGAAVSLRGPRSLQMGLFDDILGGGKDQQNQAPRPTKDFVPPKATVPDVIPQAGGFVPPKATVPESVDTTPEEGVAPPVVLPPKQVYPTEGEASTLLAPRPVSNDALKNADLVDNYVPDNWVEQRDYKREGKLEPGNPVMVRRSDGSTKWGEVIKKSGFLWEDLWTVAVTKKPDGTVGSSRIENGVMLGRPMPEALARARAEVAALAEMDAELEAGDSGDQGGPGASGGKPQAYI